MNSYPLKKRISAFVRTKSMTVGRWSIMIGCAPLVVAAMMGHAQASSQIAFFNESNPDKGYKVEGKDPIPIASVTLALEHPSNVLVQFTSHATTEDTVGCPCSVRASV